jgi:hypothetical protein
LRLNAIQIRDIEVTGTSAISSGDVKAVAEEALKGKYFFIIPRSNAIFYPNSKMSERIIKQYPRIENIDISLSSFHSIKIDITERKAIAVWCDSLEPSNCFLIDKSGFVFDKSPNISANVYFVFKGQLAGDPVGKYYLSADGQFVKIRQFIENVKNLGIEPNALSFFRDQEYELGVKGGGKILFLFEGNGERALSNLRSVLDDLTLKVLSDGMLNVSGIDLRYGNKVILKK